MAARKSCTHLTWAEAKSKTGQISSGQKKNKEVLRKQNHGQVLANKIIAKQGGHQADAESKKLKKQYRKQEEKAAMISAQRAEEREQQRLAALQEVKPYDRVVEKMQEMLQDLRENSNDNETLPKIDIPNPNDEETQRKIAECKQMQVDELMALEAMIPETDFVVSMASRLDELKEKLDQFAGDDSDTALLSEIVNHPPIAVYIKLEVDDEQSLLQEDDDMELNCMLLLRITFPPLYLDHDGGSQMPLWEFPYVMVTDKTVFSSADKALESLAYLDEGACKEQMEAHANDGLLPYPCVYEVAVTWLSENIFNHLKLQAHLLATKQ